MRIVVEEGPNRGALYELGRESVLGRGEGCELQILDDGISRRHAQILREDQGWTLRDLESRNGTRLNGVPVESAALVVGDRITLGTVRLRVLSPPTEGDLLAAGGTRELDLDPPPLPGAGFSPEGWIGESPLVRELLRRVSRAAPTEATCLIQGESGTGKELVARALHRLSPRRQHPFVVLNCAALPAELVESELFGHERGAFTGAVARKVGLAEAAAGGTLFLDELGELPGPAQAKLLRFLEDKEILRVGSTTPRRVDVRVLAATHRDLDACVREGTFREDLLHRLRVVELLAPPLRERGADGALLAESFLRQFAGPQRRFTAGALAAIQAYPWPGNVRELKNVIEAAVIFAEEDEIRALDLPSRVRAANPSAPTSAEAARQPVTLREAEHLAILAALEHTGGHRTKTAELLGVDRKTLYSKLKQYGIG
ncbi:MAG: sigma 54-interacting transcriptional regulator [Planctomycetes bacterium]|nr:sigma 54-interacting transcriptional regulator [Planctomycetota bacterium]